MKNLLPLLLIFAAACGTAPSEEPTAERESTTKADGNPWCHADFNSTDGTQMVFDYQVASKQGTGSEPGVNTFAKNVWLNVRNPSFKSTDSAQAVVLSASYAGECGDSCAQFASQDHVSTVSLHYENGRFTAPISNLPIWEVPESTDGSDMTAHYWELAVVVNGTWYKDQRGNNLRFLAADAPGYCASGTSF